MEAFAETNGHTQAGLGASLYRYDESSTEAIDGGFVLPGAGGSLSFDASEVFDGTAGVGRWIMVDQSRAHVESFGAIGNGRWHGRIWRR